MWYRLLLWAWMIIAVVIFVVLLLSKRNAPFGKFTTSTWGARIHNRLGWFIMELPAPLVFPLILFASVNWKSVDALLSIIVAMWLIHYAHRAFIFPFRIRPKPRSMPISVMAMALCYNIVNGSFLGYYYTQLYVPSPVSPPLLGRVGIGLAIFIAGLIINIYHDSLLINLRRRTDSNGYVIPTGGLFAKISAPNLFGEVMEWTGFAIVAWSLPALSMAVWIAASLTPRAYGVHRWYLSHFPDYPSQRRAFFPSFSK